LAVRTLHAKKVSGLQIPVNNAEGVSLGDGDASLQDEPDGLFDR
jgi:hypothetical protein